MLFSQRKGLKPVKSVVQLNDVDKELRNGLWNMLQLCVWESEKDAFYLSESGLLWLFRKYWHGYFKIPVDTLPESLSEAIGKVRVVFFDCRWYEVYDFIEFTANNIDDEKSANQFVGLANVVMERELSSYRFIDKKIVQISSEQEIQSIEEALTNTDALKGAHAHLQSSLALLADRKNPDFRNSIKEAISAVESISQTITGDPGATLGAALKSLEREELIHPALKASLSALYGYTSDSNGIRHAMLDEPTLTFNDAKFMLVACTAFVNYMAGKAAEGGIKLS